MANSWRDGGIHIVVLPIHPNDSKEFHLYDKAALLEQITQTQINIEIFEGEIGKLRDRIVMLQGQVEECDERDRAIAAYEKEVKQARKKHGDAVVDEALKQQKEALRNGNARVSSGRSIGSVRTG
ncbi:MAG: hypothetical protein AMS18_08150 [Gemmatimonas sp. SG8_17]|nr:MAG: hypothetical protein AMS18_08150 [Gemmatimonas sp. SG8_17]